MGGKDPPDPPLSYASVANGRMSPNVRAYAEIVAKHKKQRNMIEIQFIRNRKDGETGRLNRNVELNVVSDYLFGELNIDPAMILEVDLNTGKIDTKQILFRPEVDVEEYISNFPDTFGDYSINITRMTSTEKKITFKQVPAFVPDEEILNLCALYGDVEGGVQREKINLCSNNKNIYIQTSTRFVMMRLKPGAFFNNYYWLEGPLQGDQGRRITVLHSGQPQQCSLCLESVETGCLGLGNGKKCEENGGTRKRMSEYMKELKEKTGYISLKEEYLNSMKKLHEKFDNDLNMQKPEDMDQYVIDGEDEEDEQVEAGSSLKEKEFVHPIKQRDMKIDELTENIVKLEKEVPILKLDNTKKRNKNKKRKRTCNQRDPENY